MPEIDMQAAARDTADPVRAERNLERLLGDAVADASPFVPGLYMTAKLFAHSQFLANYAINNPQTLLSALGLMDVPHDRDFLEARAAEELELPAGVSQEEAMKRLRHFRRQYMMSITLRDLSCKTDTISAAGELSSLADVVIHHALAWSVDATRARHGAPEGLCSIVLIGLGKLGGEELNYSSDVDLLAVYENGQGETEGVPAPSGVLSNRVSNHEFYCTSVNIFTKILSASTDDGVGYRVDLRLRPQGQKGEVALPLEAYRRYYESWGRTWERMVLTRARPVAGDMELGRRFTAMVEPFLWRHTVDYTEIEDIRAMKKKIDSIVTRDDIKRGYGGIREAEFFVQTFQVLYGAEHPELKTSSLHEAIMAIGDMGLVPREELDALWEAYVFYRRVEHYLQMADDLQTYTLPSAGQDRTILARKMGFKSEEDFSSELRMRRMKIKNMYNSLLGSTEDKHAEALTLLEGSLNSVEMESYLAFRGLEDVKAGAKNMWRLRERASAPMGPDELALVRRSVPGLLERALSSESPDRALGALESFLSTYGMKGAYLRSMLEQEPMAAGLSKIFALSPVLTRLLLASPDCMNWLVEEMPIKKTRKKVFDEVGRLVVSGKDFEDLLGKFKGVEWLRLGMFFLSGIMPVGDLQRYLSNLAEALLWAALVEARGEEVPFSIIAMGKFGGREITFGSDLDLIFVSESDEGIGIAKSIIHTITSYTGRGMLYEIDTRLRPDGEKGELVKTLEGYRKYYMQHAQGWEVQSLVRARPVAGDKALGREFLSMARSVIAERGGELALEDIVSMRKRIMDEFVREDKGLSVKLGPGGLEDIEFHVQWMQLQAAQKNMGPVIPNTPAAIRRLVNHGDMAHGHARVLLEAYDYFRRLQSFLWLNGESLVVPGAPVAAIALKFMGHISEAAFLEALQAHRSAVLGVLGR